MPVVPRQKKKCGVLGVTGSVGQRFVLLLADHLLFDLQTVGASSKTAGKSYQEAVKWKQITSIPSTSRELIIQECRPEFFQGLDLVFSALDADIAGDIELAFVQSGIPVFSNAKNHRHNPLVPLVVPTVNISHLDLLPYQQQTWKERQGFLVCNSNCAVIGVVVPLAALEAKFGPIAAVEVFTAQAISGAGYPGVSAMDIVDNMIPFISGEEEKLEPEARKILGNIVTVAGATADKTHIADQTSLTIDATCSRVAVSDGHMVYASVRFATRPPPSITDITHALQNYEPEVQRLGGCPSSPRRAIVVLDRVDRPQPRMDRDIEGGMAVSVGRIRAGRESGFFDVRFVALSHNTILGAAGSSVLNAEAALTKGFL